MTIVRRKRTSAAVEQKAAPWRDLAGWRGAAALALAVLIFYWIPLTDPKTSIQWDAVDVHYSPQKYFADTCRRAVRPFGTPSFFSGFPFWAVLRVAACYRLIWPFFRAAVPPTEFQWTMPF